MILEVTLIKLIESTSSYLGNQLGRGFFEKYRINRKLKKIKSFRREYDNTQIDTNSFQNFLNLESTQYLIFNYLFSSKYIDTTKHDIIHNLSVLAKDYINEKYANNGRSKLIDNGVVEDYFIFLVDELIDFREGELSSNEKSIVASIQNSILESNAEIKKFVESKFDELINYSLAKHLTEKKIDELLARSIESLSGRYNSRANVETVEQSVFSFLLFEEDIKNNLNNYFNQIVKKINIIYVLFEKMTNLKAEIISKKLELHEISLNLNNFDCYNSQNYFEEEYRNIIASLRKLEGILSRVKYEIYDSEEINEYRGIIEKINETQNAINEVYEFSMKVKFISNPYLVIQGEGGIGKSHLLAKIGKEKRENGHIVFLFLGQHFNSTQQPFEQIFSFLEYHGDSDSFLSEINARAKRSNKRALILIDALNEGQGKYFWNNYIIDFLNKVKKFSDISLVFSNRTNHMKTIFPEGFFETCSVSLIEHRGFSDLTLNELSPFLNFYKISPIQVPSLQPECRNPLFLSLYCEVASTQEFKNSIGWSITEVLSLYIKKVNDKLSKDKRFQFIEHIDLINIILKGISQKMLSKREMVLSIDEIQDTIASIASKYTEGHYLLFNGFLEENLLNISKNYQGHNDVYFSYERFGDIYIADEIVQKLIDTEGQYLEESYAEIYQSSTILESLSIVTPEKMKKELFDIVKSRDINVYESFIRGLSWRKSNSIDGRTLCFIEESMNINVELRNLVYEQFIQLSYANNSALNADYLHNHLMEMTLADRDSKWTIFLNSRPEIINRIIEMANFKEEISDEVIKALPLIANTIIWMFSSSHRILRDKATITLVSLFKDNMSMVLPLLEKFKIVNDPYIQERLYAAVYGACVRTEDTKYHFSISEFVITEIFERDEVFPHILLRDYARGIILNSEFRGLYKIEDFDIITPPYKSNWYLNIPTLDEIDMIEKQFPQEIYGKKSYSITSIIQSMTTEYGRGTGAYGDFGRYTFESALNMWANQFDVQDLSNIATKRVFQLGYDINKHGEHDLMNGNYFGRHSNTHERIGKKYQWIAFHEMLARISDNFTAYEEEIEYEEEYLKSIKFNTFHIDELEKLWNESPDISKSDSDLKEEYQVIEQEIDESKYIKNKITNNIDFKGPWNPYVRDIDPTLLLTKKKDETKKILYFPLPSKSDEDWVHDEMELNSGENIFEIEYASKKYISLGVLSSNKKENGLNYKDRDEVLIKTKSVFIDKANLDVCEKKLLDVGTGISWMESYQSFAFEYFWHPSFIDSLDAYKEYDEKYYSKEGVWSYIGETRFDFDNEEELSISYLIPGPYLVQYFDLVQKQEGQWVDSQDNVIAIDASLLGYESNLLFDKNKLEQFLRQNNLTLFWKVYIEKVSSQHFHEWWALYRYDEEEYSHRVLKESKGKLNY